MDTVAHEVAHALVGPAHGHDAVWRRKAVELGGSGTPHARFLRSTGSMDWRL